MARPRMRTRGLKIMNVLQPRHAHLSHTGLQRHIFNPVEEFRLTLGVVVGKEVYLVEFDIFDSLPYPFRDTQQLYYFH